MPLQAAILSSLARVVRQPRSLQPSTPCQGCPLDDERRQKVRPVIPRGALVCAVGLGSGLAEQNVDAPFVGEGGRFLRRELSAVGLRAGTVDAPRSERINVGFANLTRCRPDGEDFDSAAWRKAADRCRKFLDVDLAGQYPLLLLGTKPTQRLLGDVKATATRMRGLWHQTLTGRAVFVTRHPASVMREIRRAGNDCALAQQFRSDLQRMANRLLKRETFPRIAVEIYESAAKGRQRLRWLAARTAPWFFDIETFDANAVPSRLHVATDPFHPDFRVRGVAVAWGPTEGAWFELMADEQRKAAVARLLDPAFSSDAEKGAFVGGFDESGLVVPGWVTAVRMRTRDPWLASIALDAQGGGHSLERLVVDVLGEPQPVGKSHRGRIREMSLQDVATYAVNDACAEWRLDVEMQRRLDAGAYL